MRLLLDANVSARAIAVPLRKRGHDVLAADEHRTLDGASDEELLELAAAQGRIVITFDVKDFPPLIASWAAAGRRHAGCIVVVGIRNDAFGTLLGGLAKLFAGRPEQADWKDLLLFLARSTR